MKALFFVVCAVLTINPLHSFNVSLHDQSNLYFFNSNISFVVNVTNTDEQQKTHEVTISNATPVLTQQEVRDLSVFYTYVIAQTTPSFITQLSLTLEAQKSKDQGRRYIEEFELTATFDGTTEMRNWTGIPLSFIVKPPRFPHFQVKTDWKYECTKPLSLQLCHVDNGTTGCTKNAPYTFATIHMYMDDTAFYGGNNVTHNYENKVEQCPLAYETKTDVGIACIVTFWTIVLAVFLWGFIKFLLKRHRKRYD